MDITQSFSIDPWNFTRIGAYGVFFSKQSLPVEFLQTSITSDELGYLKLAREVNQEDEVDFELLMQRDIDDGPDGAIAKLRQYLVPPQSPTPSSVHSVFFPPLLVACVPCEGNKTLANYPEENWRNEDSQIIRTWGNLFELSFFKTESAAGFTLKNSNSKESVKIHCGHVQAKFNLSDKFEKGIKLIAIDGQHRLKAMKDLMKQTWRETYVVPVCILFATHTSLNFKMSQDTTVNEEVPNVHQTFRKIFIDVNNNMTPVGTHFNILLNDNNVGNLIVREFCGRVAQQGKEHLCGVEWNVRKKKDATKLTRKYSITSIGIIDMAIQECFKHESFRGNVLPRLLGIEDQSIKDQLANTAVNGGSIEWENYSIGQKNVLLPHIRNGVVELFYKIFFETEPYKSVSALLIQKLKQWQKIASENSEARGYSVEDYDLAYSVVTTDHSVERIHSGVEARKIVSELGSDIEEFTSGMSDVMRFALFQRAIVLSLKEYLIALDGFTLREIESSFRYLIKETMKKRRNLFGYQTYTTETIWRDESTIHTPKATMLQFSRLLLSLCGVERISKELSSQITSQYGDEVLVKSRLKDLGQRKANEYWKHYREDRVKEFKRYFTNRFGLEKEDVDELQKAREQQEEEGSGRPFDVLVNRHLESVFSEARTELEAKLKFKFYASEDERTDEDADEE